ncbi:MAG: hypothetical protein JWN73_2078 [Betaproteobacteria bacterium]|nr:hypothetical protein [Betaproteobacteria bacterium]
MFKQLLRSLKKPAAPAPGGVDASLPALMTHARTCYELETPAGDAECEQTLARVLKREPDNPLAHFALALLLAADGAFERAEKHLRAAYARDPGDGYMLYTLVMVLLQRNNYLEGFRLFSAWLHTLSRPAPQIAALPGWRGESLEGKTLVLWTDWGGFGDDIAYGRFARTIRETRRPARLIVAARAPLLRLFAGQPYIDEAVDLETTVKADVQCAMIEAPHVLGTELSTLPAWPRYLQAPAPESAAWAKRLQSEQRLKVGLVWTSTSIAIDPAAAADRSGRFGKYLPDQMLAGLGDLPGVVFVSLQKGADLPKAAQLLPGAAVIDDTDELRDFADTAALISQLDLVLTIDTSIAHLAGALGVPTLLLLRKSLACFWPQGRADTPWYPSVRMLVQPQLRDWTHLLARTRAILARRAAGVPWPQCCDPACDPA